MPHNETKWNVNKFTGTELRETAIEDFEIGDIYAGVYCGVSQDDGYNLVNCPLGSYCPTPEEMFPCPAGFYCPHKTAVPDIVCNRCQEGALKLERDWFGYVGLFIIASLIIAFVTLKLVQRYNQDFFQRLLKFERQVFRNKLTEFEHRIQDWRASGNGPARVRLFNSKNKSSQQEMKKIRHKIELINRRLAAYEENRSNTSKDSSKLSDTAVTMSNTSVDASGSSSRLPFFRSIQFISYANTADNMGGAAGELSVNNASGSNAYNGSAAANSNKSLRFDARRVFDALDVKSEGEVSFDELNVILGLNDLELYEFKRRLNELAGYERDRRSVTRPIFVKYFLQVIKETSNLTVSFEEAGFLFDEMMDDTMPVVENVTVSGTTSTAVTEPKLHMSAFYNSSVS